MCIYIVEKVSISKQWVSAKKKWLYAYILENSRRTVFVIYVVSCRSDVTFKIRIKNDDFFQKIVLSITKTNILRNNYFLYECVFS